ncbi:MAG: RNA polymerase sigma-70 factor [Chitinophagaceae bacterium]|nr:RNA polymerase sigma-70 factor [Chitinophagaceae bacterium]
MKNFSTIEINTFHLNSESDLSLLFKESHKSLCFFAGRYVKDVNAALDIVEESFVKVWAKREQFNSDTGLRSYLYKTVHNGCLKWLEQEKRKASILETYCIISESTEQACFENIVRAETLRQLHTAIGQLPNQCRTIVQKLYIDGKTVAEIATEMNLTASTVKNQKARGIKLLKIKLT